MKTNGQSLRDKRDARDWRDGSGRRKFFLALVPVIGTLAARGALTDKLNFNHH